MKILHLANCGGELAGGGIYQVAKNLFDGQRKKNVDVSLKFPGGKEQVREFSGQDGIEVINNVGSSFFVLLRQFFSRTPEKFDLVHQHGVYLATSLLSILYSIKGIPVIIQPHGLMSEHRIGRNWKKIISLNTIERLNISLARMVVVTCEAEYNFISKKYPKASLALVPNGINLSQFIGSSETVSDTCDLRKIVFLSKISPVKGIDRLIEAVSIIGKDAFAGWNIEIAGTDDFDLIQGYTAQIDKLGLQGLIQFKGQKSGNDKISFLSQASAFVFPSYDENFGIVVIEALACGVPVVATKGTPWAELETNQCGWWVDNSVDGIVRGLELILTTPDDTLKEMGKNGIELVRSKYDWDDINDKFIQLYNYLLGGGSSLAFVHDKKTKE